MFVPLTSAGIIIAATAPSPASDFFSSLLTAIINTQVVGVIIGFALSLITLQVNNKNQTNRDQLTYKRSLNSAKRERLRGPYKVLLEAANKYQQEAQKHDNKDYVGSISLAVVDDALNEITLEDVNSDVPSIFNELRKAYYAYDANWSMPDEGTLENVKKYRNEISVRVRDLRNAMDKNLKELES